MSRHRNAERAALVSKDVQRLLHQPSIRLVNYRIMNEEKGRGSMKRPLK
jgi:hypothetical protein